MAGKYIFHFEDEWMKHRVTREFLELYKVSDFLHLEWALLLYDVKYCTERGIGFDATTPNGEQFRKEMCASVVTLGLSIAMLAKLKKRGIQTVGYLLAYTEYSIVSHGGFTWSEAERLKDILGRKGLQLRVVGTPPTFDCLWRVNQDGDYEPASQVVLHEPAYGGGWGTID